MRITKLTRRGELSRWLDKFNYIKDACAALDLETTGLGKGSAILSGAITGETPDEVAVFGPELLTELLSAPPNLTYVLHNASFDLKHLSWAGIRLQDNYGYIDTLVLAHLNDENGEHGLGPLVLKHFNDNYKTEFWSKYKTAREAPEDELLEYNARDVSYTMRLYSRIRDALRDEGVPNSLIIHVHSLQRSLLETEIAGLKVDREYLMEKGIELKTRIDELLPKMRNIVADQISLIETEDWLKAIEKLKTPKGKARVKKPDFSFDSAKQLMALLYDKLKLPVQYNEKSKNPSVDYDSLEKLKDKHPIIAQIQEYRELQKIYGTYIQGTLERIVDGRIYPSFNVSGTATGRVSHSNPNMANLPSSGGIRGMFTPDDDHVFISADFSQLEVCVSAHFTRDPNLLRIINEGASMHDITAASLGIERSVAKTLNFGMQYGCSHYKVAKVLGVSEAEGKKAYDKYWETYSGQKKVMDECGSKVDAGIPITSPFGRRRRFDACKRRPTDPAYRQAWNALVQGTGSDCTSRALYVADAALRTCGIGKALFSVHDEIVIQAKKDHAKEAEEILIKAMIEAGEYAGLSVELKAESSGPMTRWQD